MQQSPFAQLLVVAREACCLLEFPRAAFLEIYNGNSGATVSLQHALHRIWWAEGQG